MKHIVTSGCSFSNTEDCVDYTTHGMDHHLYQLDNYKSWALHLEDIIPDSKVYNRALPGVGNAYIVRSIIWQVNELLKQNIKPNVFMQMTSFDRKELLLDCNDLSSETDGNLQTHYIPDIMPRHIPDIMPRHQSPHFAKKLNNNKVWLKHSYVEDSMMRYHYKYYHNDESALVESLEHILRLQWFLKLNNINYKIFPGWNIIQRLNHHTLQKESNEKLIFGTTEVNFLWEMIDFDNVWFYKNYGGITEWSEDNLPFKDRYVTGERRNKEGTALDQHPSNTAHREFAKQAVSKWIK